MAAAYLQDRTHHSIHEDFLLKRLFSLFFPVRTLISKNLLALEKLNPCLIQPDSLGVIVCSLACWMHCGFLRVRL